MEHTTRSMKAMGQPGGRLSLGPRRISGLSTGISILILVAGLMLPTNLAQAAEQILWQIGKPDHASLEFNDLWDFSRDPIFVVGKSSPEKDWSSYHPGAEDRAGGHRVHPFTVIFEIPTAPRGVFYLTVDAMFKSPHIPEYFVEINGKKGRFHFRPELTYETGDPNTAWNIIFSVQRLKVALPAAYFRKGENRIVLTCDGDLSRVILRQSKPPSAGSGIFYDAVQLSQDPAAKFEEVKAQSNAYPTICYRHRADGRLGEVILLEVSSTKRFERGTVALLLGKEKYICELASGYDFGQAQCSVEVPELTAATQAKLFATLGGKSSSNEVHIVPQKKWKLFLAPQMHLDMGYTDYRAISYEVHNRNIDEIIKTMESRPDYKFNPDGSFIFEDYWKHRGEQSKERCLKLLREGRLALPAQFFTINSGLASQEELN